MLSNNAELQHLQMCFRQFEASGSFFVDHGDANIYSCRDMEDYLESMVHQRRKSSEDFERID